MKYIDAVFIPDEGFTEPGQAGIRPSSTGFATIHGQVFHKDDVPLACSGRESFPITDPRVTKLDIFDPFDVHVLLEGQERWRIHYTNSIYTQDADIEFLAGQFRILRREGDVPHRPQYCIKCDCGWHGKWRMYVARGNMNADVTQRHGYKCSLIDRQQAKAVLK